MALGINRENDTPIGGLPEFRGNLQGGGVFGVDDVPVFDGEKFAPGTNSALLNAYGGLATAASAGHLADGSLIDAWDSVTPLGGTPLQTTPDEVAGTITTAIAGTWEISFQCNMTNLVNNEDYFFQLVGPDGNSGFGSHIEGSNNVNSQSTGFVITLTTTAPGIIAVGASSGSDSGFDIVSATFSVTRIG